MNLKILFIANITRTEFCFSVHRVIGTTGNYMKVRLFFGMLTNTAASGPGRSRLRLTVNQLNSLISLQRFKSIGVVNAIVVHADIAQINKTIKMIVVQFIP